MMVDFADPVGPTRSLHHSLLEQARDTCSCGL